MKERARLSAALTIRSLQAGAAFVSGLFVAALVLHLLGNDLADRAASLGVVALIATPAVAMAATAVESWNRERATAVLALMVIGVLGVASAVALLIL